MNRKIALTFVIASAAAVSAFAETPLVDVQPPFKSTMSREQVKAELQQHRQGGIDTFADGYNQLTGFRSTLTRGDVKSEFISSRDQVSAMNSEDGGARYMAHRQMPRSYGRQLAALPAAE